MIVGHGVDMIDIGRIEATLARFGERFVQRCFHETEIAKANRRAGAGSRMVAATYAKRYAAKEAVAKALGTGLARGVFWKDIEIVNLASGQPMVRLHGGAARRAAAMMPAGRKPHWQLSLSDERSYAMASVLLSAS